MTRSKAQEYRRLAQECLAMARTVSTEEARAALLERSEVWLRLANEQDDDRADIEGPLAPRPVEAARPVVQQQQQAQPNKDDNNEKD
ncbi:MAG: hypothetical protein WBW74_11680 [Xanthobacteraceae bacterium]